MNYPIFVSGPHGSGKTTLINKLKAKHDIFFENDFDIDFLTEFPNIKKLSNFERCLIRLYHRIYLTSHANSLAAGNPEKVIITSRGIYDSAAYIHTYKKLNWFSSENSEKLNFIVNNSGFNPYTIVLNPPPEVVTERLEGRRSQGTRKERDEVFISEDSKEFVESICEYFRSLKNNDNVLYLGLAE
ncbi:AAA family ATPase [Paenibacillus thailandensis]|uniref:AAA family ATPase n=1 Tax=Paenibacillus thailandensis TaxID=393250 RepID=A0ABW5R1S5_9BACL